MEWFVENSFWGRQHASYMGYAIVVYGGARVGSRWEWFIVDRNSKKVVESAEPHVFLCAAKASAKRAVRRLLKPKWVIYGRGYSVKTARVGDYVLFYGENMTDWWWSIWRTNGDGELMDMVKSSGGATWLWREGMARKACERALERLLDV